MRLISLLIKVFLIINFIFISNLSANSFQNLSMNIKEYKNKFSWKYFITGIDELIMKL